MEEAKTGKLCIDEQDLQLLEEAFDRLIINDLAEPVPQVQSPIAPFFEKLEKLRVLHQELGNYTVALSQGNVDVDTPSRKNFLASGIKQLHAQLRHLTWQTQCIAKGDYNQHVDFMGEFSDAFNTMIRQLSVREAHINAQRDIMVSLFDKIEPIAIVEEGEPSNVLYANQMARACFGIEPGMPIDGMYAAFFRDVFVFAAIDRPQQVAEPVSGKWFSVTCAKLPWVDDMNALVYHCTDITVHKQREDALERTANTDALTALMNRRAYDMMLEREWALCQRLGEPISMLMFDIDHFKDYNDNFGHLHGDQCLVMLAKVLKKTIARSSDAVARYGGEEFCALLPFTDQAGAMSVAEAVRSAVCAMPIAHREDAELVTHIAVSIGVTTVVPVKGLSSEQLIAASDVALYKAKQSGRNCVRYGDIQGSFTVVQEA